MAYILSTLRSRVRSKLNQLSTNSNQVWEDSELNGYINDSIKHFIVFAPIEFIETSVFKRTKTADGNNLVNNGDGYASKPSDYIRYVNSKVDDVWTRRKIDLSEVEFLQGNSLTEADTTRKYIADVSGSEFLILPIAFNKCELIYLAQPSSDLVNDNDPSPLKDVGDTYMIDWAYALALESKQFKPEMAQIIFKRVQAILTGKQ